MYIHAYQSYVWNAIVSERIHNFGCHAPVVDDLVFEKTPKKPGADETEQIMDTSDEIDVDDSFGDSGVSRRSNAEEAGVLCSSISWSSRFLIWSYGKDASGFGDDGDDVAENSSLKSRGKPYVTPKVKTLTESDLSDYTIYNVIMPLPGFDVAYPGDDLGEKYKGFMRADGLDPNNMTRSRRQVVLIIRSGPYLCVFSERHPEIIHYLDPTAR
jgi:tRNA pseudouridine13 synthase